MQDDPISFNEFINEQRADRRRRRVRGALMLIAVNGAIIGGVIWFLMQMKG